jgi:hypothetical protein
MTVKSVAGFTKTHWLFWFHLVPSTLYITPFVSQNMKYRKKKVAVLTLLSLSIIAILAGVVLANNNQLNSDISTDSVSGADSSQASGKEIAPSDTPRTVDKVITDAIAPVRIDPDQTLKILLEPEKQTSRTGSATYTITIKDLHLKKDRSYNYNLKCDTTISDKLIDCKIRENSFTLGAGQTKTIDLTVESKQRGVNIFAVLAENEDSQDNVRGVLIVGTDEYTPEPTSTWFVGKGTAISRNSDREIPVSLNALKSNQDIKGKFVMGDKIYIMEGTAIRTVDSEEDSSKARPVLTWKVKFLLSDIRTKNKGGEFIGEAQRFSELILIKGDLEIEDQLFSLAIVSREGRTFTDREPIDASDRKITTKTELRKITPLKKLPISNVQGDSPNSANGAEKVSEYDEGIVYIRPVKIRRAKIFGFIPNPWGARVLDIEIINGGGQTVLKTIKASTSSDIAGYKIGVGSLENDEDISLTVENAE